MRMTSCLIAAFCVAFSAAPAGADPYDVPSLLLQQPGGHWNPAHPSWNAAPAAQSYGRPAEPRHAIHSASYAEKPAVEPEHECCPDDDSYRASDWYGSVAALVMTRDKPNHVCFTGLSADPVIQPIENRFDYDWQLGGEITVGRCVCDTKSIEVTYWSLDQFSEYVLVSGAPGTYDTSINVGNVVLDPGGDNDSASSLFDGAASHMLRQTSEVHSFEVNFVRQALLADDGDAFNMVLMAGVRFFKFDDALLFGSSAPGPFGTDPTEEVYLDVDLENDLFGIQIGAEVEYDTGGRWSWYIRPKIGIYDNHMSLRTHLYRGDGAPGQAQPPANPVVDFPITSSEDDVSFLAEIDIGVRRQLRGNWRAFLAYRAVVVTGVALADEQIPPYLADTIGLADIDSNAELVLHGAVAGLMFNY